jgi:hypothetical protein
MVGLRLCRRLAIVLHIFWPQIARMPPLRASASIVSAVGAG